MFDLNNLEKLDDKQLEQLRALGDPLRRKILLNLQEARTVTKIADALGINRKLLYYHIRILLKAGLITEVETHQVGPAIESVYVAVNIDIGPSKHTDSSSRSGINRLIIELIEETVDDCKHTVSQNEKKLVGGGREFINIKSENVRATSQRINDMAVEFMNAVKELNDEDGDIKYSVTHAHFTM